ncbi:hypothetical protein Tco_1304312 [Tanacetum coccineum]
MYGKIWYDEDVHDLRSVETEFPAIVYNDALTSEVARSCEPMVSPLNDNQIEFRISFDKSEDEDYTVIYDKSSFTFKIISVNDLKTDSENNNDKVNMPSFSSSEPTDEPTLSPQHIDEFNLKTETSLSECDDNDNEKVDIKQPSGDISVIPLPNVINADVGAYAQGSNKSITIWAKLVRILISEGSLSLLKILGKKSLAEMFTRIPYIESLLALRLVAQPQVNPDSTIAHVEQITPFRYSGAGGPPTLEHVTSCIIRRETYCSSGFERRIVGCKHNPTSVE